MKKQTGPHAGTATITQDELAELKELLPTSVKYTKLRHDVRDRALAGAAVAPGPLALNVETFEERRITRATLEESLGGAAAKVVIDAVPRTVCRRMTVVASPPNAPAQARPAFDPDSRPKTGELTHSPRLGPRALLARLAKALQPRR